MCFPRKNIFHTLMYFPLGIIFSLNTNLSYCSSRDQKSKVKVLEGSVHPGIFYTNMVIAFL